MNFIDFNLNEMLLEGLNKAGYTECTEVQSQVLQSSQDGSDLYVQSQTGTGKTAAYLVAIIQEMLSKEPLKKALIMVPTRELAVQVEEEAKVLISSSKLKAFSFYGGVGYEKQISALKKGVDIIIGTPGRLIDLQEGKNLDLSQVGFVVVDEADRMFDMGFYPDLRKILKFVPKAQERQTMLFSATLNSYVKNLAWEYTLNPKEIEIECENITVSEITQELFHVSSDEKIMLLNGILKRENPKSVIIFCNTKRSCEVVAKRLQLNDFKSDFIIGDLPQSVRLKKLNSFKDGTLSILVATDVAARGIDVSDLEMVINYDLPNEAENYEMPFDGPTYVHRIGRTARAGKSGKAYTFCSEQDVYNLPAIERYIEMQIPSHVAYPEELAEDKSKGIYIKLENYRDEEKSSSREKNYKSSKNKKTYGDKKSSGKKSYSKKDSYSKERNSKNYAKTSEKEFEKLESLPFEQRLKFYKEKYAASCDSYQKKSSPKKEYNYKNSRKKGSKGGYIKKNYPEKDLKNNIQNKKPQKKGFLEKLKALFKK